jgi:gamma-glutamylcyclotransferase (GGCT)/AIG2-like uncharacterized protein YtfP
MCEDIMEEVAGGRYHAEPGVLKGFRRRVVRGELYPGIHPRENCEVPGVVYRGITPDAWRRLDAFEGVLYERRELSIILHDGGEIRAGTYVVKPEFVSRLSPEAWHLEEFLKNGKALFRKSYGGYEGIG